MKKEDSMGDGKNLKKYLDEKGTNVRKIAKATGISATTLYSIIQKDSNIRFDFALRLANELQIDVNEICSASPFSDTIKEEEIYPTLPDGLNGALDASRVKTYLKNSMYPLMYLFGKNSMPDVDNLLTSFYQLDDEARQEVVETIRLKLQYHRDPERAEQINVSVFCRCLSFHVSGGCGSLHDRFRLVFSGGCAGSAGCKPQA